MSAGPTSDTAAVPVLGEALHLLVGFVAIVGRPNVGKSTLLNQLVQAHVSITSRRPQTTRERVIGVRTDDNAQYIFVDTPGFQRQHRSLLTRKMNQSVTSALVDVDAVIMVIDARGWQARDEAVVALLPRPGRRHRAGDTVADAGAQAAAVAPSRVILAVNKIDELAHRDVLLPLLAESATRYPFAALVPISAEKGEQIDALLHEVRRHLTPGVALFEADQFTDRSVRFLAAETIREKAFRLLGDEIPYGIAVTIEVWQESETHAEIAAAIVVERESQRGIVIGAGGAKLGEIGRLARLDIAALLGKSVRLDTHVRVRRGWSDDPRALASFGYE